MALLSAVQGARVWVRGVSASDCLAVLQAAPLAVPCGAPRGWAKAHAAQVQVAFPAGPVRVLGVASRGVLVRVASRVALVQQAASHGVLVRVVPHVAPVQAASRVALVQQAASHGALVRVASHAAVEEAASHAAPLGPHVWAGALRAVEVLRVVGVVPRAVLAALRGGLVGHPLRRACVHPLPGRDRVARPRALAPLASPSVLRNSLLLQV